MPYAPILATLGYILAPSGDQVLLIHRDSRPDDHHFGKYNGLGGKIDANEDVAASMRREIAEEAGVECLSMQLRGTISWPGFGKHGQDWFGFLFLITKWSGTPKTSNPEGSLEWGVDPQTVSGRDQCLARRPLLSAARIRYKHSSVPRSSTLPQWSAYKLALFAALNGKETFWTALN